MKNTENSYVKTVKLEASNIDVLLPDINFFIDKIERNESFHFLRFNHGIFDLYCERYVSNWYNLENVVETKSYPFEKFQLNLVTGDYNTLFNDLYYQSYFLSHENVELSKKYLKSLIRLLHGYKGVSEKLHISLSLGNGLGTIWGRWPEWHALQSARLRIISFICNLSKHKYYHSGVLKHFCVMEEHHKLFKSLNDNKFRVIVVGPSYFRLFKTEYHINDFHHLEIPRLGASNIMKNVIENIMQIKTDKTIVINSTGHLISAHLSERLLNTNIFLLDVGRSFDYDFAKFMHTETSIDKTSGWHLPNQFDKEELINHIKKLRSND